MRKVIIYGLQRSGTNYLETLLSRRFRVKILNGLDRSAPDHKHYRLYDNKDLVPEPRFRNSDQAAKVEDLERLLGEKPELFLVISKDPYSWLVSYRGWAKTCNWQTPTHHYLEEYAAFYEKWHQLSLESERVRLIRYNDLLKNPESYLSQIQQLGHLSRRWSSFLRSSSIKRVKQSRKFDAAKREAYENGKHLASLTPGDFDDVRRFVGAELMDALGYELLTPSLFAPEKPASTTPSAACEPL